MLDRVARFGSCLLSLAVSIAPLTARATPVPDGPEFHVNAATTGFQSYPKVAADGTGQFVVVWQDDYDDRFPGLENAFGRRFAADATPLGDDFQVNSESLGDTSSYYNDGMASVAKGPGGGFVVAWYADYGPGCGGYTCPFVKRYDASGAALSGEVVLNDPATIDQQHANPEIAIGGTGDFVVVWEGLDDGGGDPCCRDEGVFGRRVSAAGTPLDGEFQANTTTYNYQGDHGWLSVAADAASNFVVVWTDGNYPFRIAGRRYDAAGTPLGGEFTVSDMPGYPENPEVGMDAAGNFVVTWLGNYGVLARRFDAGGTALGASFNVSTDPQNSRYPAIDVDPAGDFVVAWVADLPGPDFNFGIISRTFDSTGAPQGDQVMVNETLAAAGFTQGPDVAFGADGKFVVVYGAYDTSIHDFEIFGRRMTVSDERLLTGGKLLVRNKVPDDPEQNLGSWLSRDPGIVTGVRGSPADPRCNGHPPGTVRATIRFVSATSGHDSGAIGLPCERWTAFGPDTATNLLQSGYKYKDTNHESGPCTSVYVRNGKLATAQCVGRGPTTDFPYDLVPGVSEGTVGVTLTTGPLHLCTAFPGPPGADGSDGKRFLAKNSAAPSSCP